MSILCDHAGKCWVADTNHWNFVAASNAVEKVFKVKPDLTREGGSIPVTLTFQDVSLYKLKYRHLKRVFYCYQWVELMTGLTALTKNLIGQIMLKELNSLRLICMKFRKFEGVLCDSKTIKHYFHY